MDRLDGLAAFLSIAALVGSIVCVTSSRSPGATKDPTSHEGGAGNGGVSQANSGNAAEFSRLAREIRSIASETSQARSAADALIASSGVVPFKPGSGESPQFAQGSLHALVAQTLVRKREEKRVEAIRQRADVQTKASLHSLEILAKTLEFSEDQKTKASELLAKQIQRIRDIQLDQRPFEEQVPELDAIEKETTERFNALLTEGQMKQKSLVPKGWFGGYLYSAKDPRR